MNNFLKNIRFRIGKKDISMTSRFFSGRYCKPANQQKVAKTCAYKKLNIFPEFIPSFRIFFLSIISALFVILPLYYIVLRGFEGGINVWSRILRTRLSILLWNTTVLTFFVILLTVFIGLTGAWLTVRTDIPGKKIWKILLSLPIAIPPYVGALIYLMIFGPTGWLNTYFDRRIFDFYNLWWTVFILGIFIYPYVYLTVFPALSKTGRNLEEAGVSCGASYKKVIRKIVLPLLKPAILGGILLVSIYVFSDFGAVSLMRYETFSISIYYNISGRMDRAAASVLSLILVSINLILLNFNEFNKKNRIYQQSSKLNTPSLLFNLGRFKYPALIFLSIIVFFSLLLPLFVLSYMTFQGMFMEINLPFNFWEVVINTLSVSLFATLICMFLSVPVIYFKYRHDSVFSRLVYRIVYSGYALPGVIIALGLIFISNKVALPPQWAVIFIIMAYVIRFLPQSVQSTEGVMAMSPVEIEESARTLGKNQNDAINEILVPSIMPGIVAGGVLAFMGAIKELPATLLLRPAGFDTLSVRIWLEAHEGFYYSAAPIALLMIIISIIPLYFMLRNTG